jgi:hypothetical protein
VIRHPSGLPGLIRRFRKCEASVRIGRASHYLGLFCCDYAAALATLAEYKRRGMVMRRGPWKGRLPTIAEIQRLVRPCSNCSCS